MRRILITGGTGFIGRHAVAALAQTGDEVHVVCRPPIPAGSEVAHHAIDLFDEVARRQLIQEIRPSHLLHIAWATRPNDPDNLTWLAVTIDLVRSFAETGGTRFVGVGSCAEYRRVETGTCDEVQTPTGPRTIYAVTKDACHRVLASYASLTGFSYAWGRVFYLYGPHEDRHRLIPHVITSLVAGRPAAIGSANRIRDFMDARDVGAALARVLQSEVEGPVNIASGKGITIGEIAHQIGDIVGRNDLIQLGTRPDPPSEAFSVVADVTRLSADVGFQPRHTLRKSLEELVAWWRTQEIPGTPAPENGEQRPGIPNRSIR